MEKFVIKGPSNNINGIVNISGAKNSCLPLMASSILFKNEVFLKNVPFVNDVFTMIKLLTSLGSKIKISIKNNKGIEINLKKFLSQKGAGFLEVKISPKQKIIPKLTFGDSIENTYPYLPKKELKKNIIKN